VSEVLVPIANGTEDMEAVIIIDVLRRAGVNVVVAGDGDVVTCARGVRIIPDVALDDLGDDDTFTAIVLPGGSQGVENLITNRGLEHILRKHQGRKGLLGAICAAPRILHEFGLLPKRAVITSHPSVAHDLASYAYSLDRVVEDGNIVTSRGAGTALEFALTLVRRLVDQTTSMRIAGDIVMYE